MRVFYYLWRTIAAVLILIVVLSGTLILYLTLTDYQPKPMEEMAVKGSPIYKCDPRHEISFLSWNIGYAGLGREMDFFYDGGEKVRPPLNQYQNYLNGIYNILGHSDTLDFILLQETDLDARRSYNINQADLITNILPYYANSVALNYDVKFVPLPLFNPMGKVTAGLLTLSMFRPSESIRINSPVNFSWPKKIFFLDRCMHLMRFPLPDSKELVVINLHHSAWSEGAELRKREIQLLEETVLREYKLGNYIVAGGDWNQPPPDHNPIPFTTGDKIKEYTKETENTKLASGWKYVYDPDIPTNRDVDIPYIKGSTKTSIIDYFLLSPNVEIKEVRTLNNGFAFSDHHPVYLRVKLMTDTLTTINPNPLQR
ncbi:MAG: endonuclease/exonuclease/phosphatase family protein [Bacteroidales bacterium]